MTAGPAAGVPTSTTFELPGYRSSARGLRPSGRG